VAYALAVRPCVFENAGIELFALLKHLVSYRPDFPLCTVAGAFCEKVQERAEIHGHDYLRGYTIREQVTGIFGGDASLYCFVIVEFNALHKIDKS
jgi:hypothetical protein